MRKYITTLRNKIAQRIKKGQNQSQTKSADESRELAVKKDANGYRIIFFFFLFLIIVFALAELALGIMIYGFKKEDNLTRLGAKIIPLPAAYTSAGVVTMADFYHEKDYINHFYSATKQASSIDKAELNKQIMNQLVENRMIENEAIKMKIKVSNKEIDDAINKIAEANGGAEQVEKVLKELYGLSMKEFRTLVKPQLVREKIAQEAIERVTVRHILIRVDQDASEDKVIEAKGKIEQYANEIAGGLSFSEAAKKYSEDVGSNEQGGLLEPFSRGEMVKEFEDVAFSSPLNAVSKPFQSSFGWHILVVEKKSGFIELSFEDWLAELKSRSIILYLYHSN